MSLQTNLIIQLLLLLVVANGSPVILKLALGKRLALPIDGGRLFIDGRPLFGRAKTWRGLFAAVLTTPVIAIWISLSPLIGMVIGIAAMSGDLLSSFFKRRLGKYPGTQMLGLDQIPEALLPLIAIAPLLDLKWVEALIIIIGFIVTELIMTKLLHILQPASHNKS